MRGGHGSNAAYASSGCLGMDLLSSVLKIFETRQHRMADAPRGNNRVGAPPPGGPGQNQAKPPAPAKANAPAAGPARNAANPNPKPPASDAAQGRGAEQKPNPPAQASPAPPVAPKPAVPAPLPVAKAPAAPASATARLGKLQTQKSSGLQIAGTILLALGLTGIVITVVFIAIPKKYKRVEAKVTAVNGKDITLSYQVGEETYTAGMRFRRDNISVSDVIAIEYSVDTPATYRHARITKRLFAAYIVPPSLVLAVAGAALFF